MNAPESFSEFSRDAAGKSHTADTTLGTLFAMPETQL